MYGYVPALRDYSFCETLHLKCVTVFQICLCLDNCSGICTVTLCTASDIFRIQNSVHSGICRHIQAYSALSSHIPAYWGILRHIQFHSSIFETLCSHRMFTTLPYSEPCNLEAEAYSKPFETLIRHIQNLATVRTVYLSIIKPYSSIFKTLLNACIFRNLTYSESWNNQNSSITASRCILRTLPYLWK